MTQAQNWPNGKRIAVAVTVMYETWSEGKAPSYTVQATGLKPGTVDHAGKAWSTYGTRNGIWRIIRNLDDNQVPATFFTNARCAEISPESVKQIVRSGHDLGGHNYTQDGLLTYMSDEEQQSTINKSLDILTSVGGKRPTGWLSSVLAFTPETAGFLAKAGLKWHADVTYTDVPHKVQTASGIIAGVPNSDFTDSRVLRSSPNDLMDVYKNTFDYLYNNEPGSLLVVTLHAHFGGRPMIVSVFDQILKYFKRHPDVWFARHEELGDWALKQPVDEHTYQDRYFK
ncbi:MAG: polysaccharide deacetylase family protein [Pseudomonadota bacterium]